MEGQDGMLLSVEHVYNMHEALGTMDSNTIIQPINQLINKQGRQTQTVRSHPFLRKEASLVMYYNMVKLLRYFNFIKVIPKRINSTQPHFYYVFESQTHETRQYNSPCQKGRGNGKLLVNSKMFQLYKLNMFQESTIQEDT